MTSTVQMAAVESGRGPDYAYMQFTGLLVFSCYWRPGGPLREFKGFLLDIEAELRLKLHPELVVMLAGDFNAKSRSWGSSVDNTKSGILEQFAGSMGMLLENVGSVPIFAMGDHVSVVDVTLARLPSGRPSADEGSGTMCTAIVTMTILSKRCR